MRNLLLSLLVMLGASASTVNAEDISAYLVGEHMDVKSARKALKGVGYKILATYDSVKDGQTIVFTNDTLIAQATKEKRAHAAVLRLFVDNQEKIISITNPVYFGRAFMQDDYNDNVFNAELEKISGAFPNLVGSEDKLEDDDIAGYHYMMSRPYYEDNEELGEGSQSELVAKAKNYQNAKSVIFELKLSDTSTLFGYELGEETKKFVEKIGRANAAVLPYTISIENGTATSLHGEYYLALSYPLLSMGTFMSISDVPDKITEDLKKAFK
ncbi:MAG: hypothetical protein ACI9TV_001505 [Sulfurimonas sp.]|jgi:hypothetical protein|uniref:hypothetical protein n=1 Tax=Sulfurimonas sp. TaxID=2022749 RepID=UPI0039E4C2F2